jgi:hypothetical protein
MVVRQRRYSKEEIARRGQELYESGIRQQVEAGNDGKIVAIDIETGAFEVDENIVPATNRYPFPGCAAASTESSLNSVDRFPELMLKLCSVKSQQFLILPARSRSPVVPS